MPPPAPTPSSYVEVLTSNLVVVGGGASGSD